MSENGRQERSIETRIYRALTALLIAPVAALAGDGFDVVALGARGGIQDGKFSAS